jgi:hypothetical protein
MQHRWWPHKNSVMIGSAPEDFIVHLLTSPIEDLRMNVLLYLDAPATPSLKINADLEEFRIILASKQLQLFDVQVQGSNEYLFLHSNFQFDLIQV